MFALLFASVVAAGHSVHAAAPDVDWVKTYGDTGSQGGWWIEAHSGQGYIVTGRWERGTPGDMDLFLMRTTASGDTIWTKFYGGQLADCGVCVRETSDGGYIVAGFIGRAPDDEDAWFVRTDADGDTLWTSTFDFGARDILMSVVEMPDGSFIAAGYTTSLGSPDSSDVLVLKIDEDGAGMWKLLWDRPHNDRAAEVCRTSDGNVAIAGIAGTGTGMDDFLIMKVSASTGDTLWTRTYGDTADDHASGIVETPDGGLIICGGSAIPADGCQKAFIMKTDADGDSIWTGAYGSDTDRRYLNAVDLTPDLGYIFGGRRDTSATYDYDMYFMKTDSNGDTLWTKTVGDTSWQLMTCVRTTSDLGYVAVGYERVPYGPDLDVYIVKLATDEAGVPEVEALPVFPLLAVDGPSPFTLSVPIRYEIEAATHVRLAVYDVTGRHVATIANGLQSAGSHRAAWDLRGESGGKAASGVYFIRCEASGRSDVEKVLILR